MTIKLSRNELIECTRLLQKKIHDAAKCFLDIDMPLLLNKDSASISPEDIISIYLSCMMCNVVDQLAFNNYNKGHVKEYLNKFIEQYDDFKIKLQETVREKNLHG